MAESTRSTSGGVDGIRVIWRRRKWLVLGVFAAVLTVAISVASFLPDRYRATATFLVERQDLEESIMRPGGADDVETRLQRVGQRIMSRARLEGLITRFDLYREARDKGASMAAIVEQMRHDIRLAPKGADDPGGAATTVAMALSYSGSDARVVSDVANALAASYSDDDLKSRQRQAGEAASFLKAQLDQAKTHYDQSSSAQARLTERKRALSRPLGQLDPTSGPDSASARLAKLRLELTELKTRYKEQHPEVMRTQDEIRALERQLSSAAPAPQSTLDGGTVKRLRESLAGVDADLMQNDYETAKERYLSLVKLYEEARLNESLAQSAEGDRFRVLDPAIVPENPVAPNRLLLVIGGIALAAGLALGSTVLAERLDTSFHTIGDLRAFTRVPVLTSIPRISTGVDDKRRRRRYVLGALATAAGLLLVVEISQYIAAIFGPVILTLMSGKA